MTFLQNADTAELIDLDETLDETGGASITICDPDRNPCAVATTACSYDAGGLPCQCGGYVARYDTYCATCSHSQSFHW